jgi:integrase
MRSRSAVRSLLHALLEFAMWAGLMSISRNPISLVQNKGATRRKRKARNLTVEQFHTLLKELREPFATMALLCVCLGLRISEALALRWPDVDWLDSRLSIKRGIVEQIVDDVKTEGSAKTFPLANELLDRLKSWKQLTECSGAEDWVLPVRSKSAGCHIPTPAYGANLNEQQKYRGSVISVPIHSGIRIALGWMWWERR